MFSNNQAGGASGKPGPTTQSGGSHASAASTPPTSTVTQQPPIQQQQQQPQHPYTYAPPHPTYSIPFGFHHLVQHPHNPHSQPHQSNPAGGVGNVTAPGGGPVAGPGALIDPMLRAMSDGGEAMSEDEDGGGNGGSAGVKNGPPSSGGNNGINHHGLEDDDYGGDDGTDQGMGGGGGQNSGTGDGQMGVTTLDENGQPVKKKRRRQALSCTECKRRKIKCDRQNPCTPCTRRGEADRCRWITQEPIEKFVTRGEYDLLHQKVMQLETIVATLAPRAFLGGLDPMNLPMGPPPFGFGPPPHPGAPPQHHPYPGPHPQQQQQQAGGPQEGQYPGGNHPPPPNPQELQAYQQHFQQAYAAATAVAAAAAAAGQQQAQHTPLAKPDDPPMDVDPAQHQQGQGNVGEGIPDHARQEQPAAGPTPGMPPQGEPSKLQMASPAAPKGGKSRKRKERADAVGDGGDESHATGTPAGSKVGKSRAKPRGLKAAPAAGWDTAATAAQDQGAGSVGDAVDPNAVRAEGVSS